MEKEFEALERLYKCNVDDYTPSYQRRDYRLLQETLQRLEAIDNANISEALEGLKHIKKYYVPQPCSAKTYDYLEIIEQYLLKAQEREKVLKIVIEKRVDLESFCMVFVDNDYYSYNYYEKTWGMYGACKLAEEEFDTVKKYAKSVAKE
jgi:hypothetical protein